MSPAHLHLLLNHVPTIGMTLGVGLFLVAVLVKSDDLRRAGLIVLALISLAALPTYVSGYSAEQTIQGLPGIPTSLIRIHQAAAFWALIAIEITGAFAWLALWLHRRSPSRHSWTIGLVSVLSLLSLATVTRAANIGGEIAHAEIRRADDATVQAGVNLFFSSAWAQRIITDYRWSWPIAEDLHFIGMAILFGIVLFINLRVLGIVRGVAFADAHRLLPWAMGAFAVNTATGMFFFISQPFQYLNIAFYSKVACVLVAGITVFYHTFFDDLWRLDRGGTASVVAKLFAVTQIVSWFGVLYFGRMLPYIGGSV